MISPFSKYEGIRGKGLCKSLCEKITYINGMKNIISTLANLKNKNITDDLKYLKYLNYLKHKVKKFFENFIREVAHSMKIESSALKTKLKILESKIHYRDNTKYIHCKEKLDKIFQEKDDGAIIRSRLDGCKYGEKMQSISQLLKKIVLFKIK